MCLESEFLEWAALQDLHRAASQEQIKSLGLKSLTLGSAFISLGRHLPESAIVINRTLGLGLKAPENRKTVREIIEAYRNAGINRYFIHIHPYANPPAIAEWLEGMGLMKVRAWQKFSRDRDAVQDSPTDLTVREIGPEYGKTFGRIVSAGFDLGDEAVPWLARLPGRPGWHIFMSFDNEKPAGAGTMFVHEDLAWMDYGATSPEYRQRGSQAAVLTSRIKLALEMGCRRMFTCTGVDVPGDPQLSYKNILKTGFQEEYIRENYAPRK